MKTVTLLTQILLAALWLHGCGEPRIDSTTNEKFKESVANIRESLPEDKRKEFEGAMVGLAMNGLGDLFSSAISSDVSASNLRQRIHGKTGEEVIAELRQMQVDKAAKEEGSRKEELETLKARAAELSKKITDALSESAGIEQFKVISSLFYFEESGFLKSPVVDVIVKNGTEHPVSAVHFACLVTSPGRAVPWVDAGLNYAIPGGLEPGEQVTLKLSPNMFGEWSKAPQDRKDLELSMKVVKLEGAGGHVIFNTEPDPSDKNELDRLRARIAAITP